MKKRAALGGTGLYSEPDPAPAASPSPRPDREAKTPMPFWTTMAARRQLKMLAAEKDTTQQELMNVALNLLFEANGLPPIAG